MTTAFELLQARYQDRTAAARTALSSEQIRTVGLAGPTAPVELVLASGLFPMRISPVAAMATPTADHYLDCVIPHDVRVLFESAMQGDFAFLELLVLTRTEDKLYYFLKELVRLGRGPKVPRLHMFDLMGSQSASVGAYNRQNIDWLLDALARAAGSAISDEDIHAACVLTNRCRELQRSLLARRWSGHVSGSHAMQAIGAGFCMHPRHYAPTLERYLSELARSAPPQSGPRLLIASSEPLADLSLHQQLEQAGGLVVAEDDAWGSRAPGNDIAMEGDPKQALLHKYWHDTAHAGISPRDARQAWFLEQLRRPELDAVIFYVPPGDLQFGWDYPLLAARAQSAGKPTLLLRQRATSGDGVRTRAAEFIDTLTTGRHAHVDE